MNLSQYALSLGEDSAGLSTEEKERVEELVVGFYEDLPENESEKRKMLFQNADKICKFDRKYNSKIEPSMLKKASKNSDDTVRRVHYAAQIANEFGDDVPLKPLSDFESASSDLTKYAPLIASYNVLAKRSCAASEKTTNESLKEFQIALLMFGVDAMLISTGAFYRPAFAGTRFITNSASKLGLYRLRYICGNRCWALGMSEIHVAIRGSLLGITSTLLRTAADMGTQLEREDLEAVAQAHDTDVATLLESSDAKIENGILKQISKDAEKCGEAVLDKAEQVSNKTDDVSKIFNKPGNYTKDIDSKDVLDKANDGLNESKDVIENCKD